MDVPQLMVTSAVAWPLLVPFSSWAHFTHELGASGSEPMFKLAARVTSLVISLNPLTVQAAGELAKKAIDSLTGTAEALVERVSADVRSAATDAAQRAREDATQLARSAAGVAAQAIGVSTDEGKSLNNIGSNFRFELQGDMV